jgi:ABC-2 type transport system ATP-binding protein
MQTSSDILNTLKGEIYMEENVVKIENLVKRYKELIALDHFNLEIKKGEVFGLLGPNGSGKTTAINCLLSLLTFDKGTIEIFGQKMTPDNYAVKKRIGVIMQNVAVFDELTVYENIDYFCGLYIANKEERKKCVNEAIGFVGLESFTKFYPKKLSGGLLRRLNIACGIAHRPELIILDEPTVAVDPQSRNKILEGIKELSKNGATVIYTTHYMEEVEQICTRIAIIDKGKNVAIGTNDELKKMIRNTETITIEVMSLDESILKAVREQPHVYEAEFEDYKLKVRCSGGKHNLIRVLGVLSQQNISFGRVYSEQPTLNDVFLEITGKALRDMEG